MTACGDCASIAALIVNATTDTAINDLGRCLTWSPREAKRREAEDYVPGSGMTSAYDWALAENGAKRVAQGRKVPNKENFDAH